MDRQYSTLSANRSLSGLDGRPRRGGITGYSERIRQGVGSVGAGLPSWVPLHHQFPQWGSPSRWSTGPDGGGGVHGLRCRSQTSGPVRIGSTGDSECIQIDFSTPLGAPCVPRDFRCRGDRQHELVTGRCDCSARRCDKLRERSFCAIRQLASAVRPGRAILWHGAPSRMRPSPLVAGRLAPAWCGPEPCLRVERLGSGKLECPAANTFRVSFGNEIGLQAENRSRGIPALFSAV